MSKKEIYDGIYHELFMEDVDDTELVNLQFGDAGWDSVMTNDVLALIEQEFHIKLKTEDKMDFDSYKKGIDILSKYGIMI